MKRPSIFKPFVYCYFCAHLKRNFQPLKNTIDTVINLTRRNLKLKYKNSILGYFWSLLTPLFYLSIFVFVFSRAFGSVENYPLYALTGLIFWQFFNNGINQIINSFISNAGIIKTIFVPLKFFPISAIYTELISFLLSLIPFTFVMLFFGLQLNAQSLFIFPYLAIFSFFILGIGLTLASLNVYLRDVSILWNTLSPALFYFSPIVYTASFVPQEYLWILKLNPLYYFFEGTRSILYHGVLPSLMNLGITATLATVAMIIGVFTLKKLSPGMVSNL